jgi:hypothetical protein
MTPCKAKAVPPLVALEDIHSPISSNKLQAAADSSSVQVAGGQEASHSISMVMDAIESRLQSQGHVLKPTTMSRMCIPYFTALLLTVCFLRGSFISLYNEANVLQLTEFRPGCCMFHQLMHLFLRDAHWHDHVTNESKCSNIKRDLSL